MFEVLRVAALLAATIAAGMMAGLFAAFSYSVMPGFARTDARTLVGGMQAINRAIANGWFLTLFFGALILPGLAAALHLGEEQRGVLPWIVAGLVLYVVTFGVTVGVNIPLNNALEAAGDVNQIPDVDAVRERFEAKWVWWNLVRTATSLAAFACLTWALVLHGQIAAT